MRSPFFCFISFYKYSIIFTILRFYDKLCDMISIKEMSGRMNEMERRGIQILFVTVFLGVLSVYASRGWVFGEEEAIFPQNMQAVNNTEMPDGTESQDNTLFLMDTESNTEAVEESEAESDAIVFYGNMKFLEDVLSGNDFTDEEWEQMFDRVWEYSEEVKGEFTPVVPEDTTLPEGLITLMEEAFYNSANSRSRDADNCFYDNKIKELGGEDFNLKLEDAYELFPQISAHRDQIENEYDAYRWIVELYLGGDSDNCIDIFHLGLTEGRDYYVFSYQSGGTSRDIYLYLMERTGDAFTEISKFGTTSYGREAMIKYDGKFYYATLEMSDDLKDYDGVRLYSLNDNVEEDTLFIRYLPEKYIWTSLYQFSDMKDEVREKVDLYVEKIKEEFAPGSYLGGDEIMHVYYGDEENVPSVEVKTSIIDSGSTVYLVDVANCGRPVYICKESRCPECCEQYLEVMLYCRPLHRGAVEEPDIDINSTGPVQTWFKEICGKVYTCQVYHLTDYNYIFRMVLLEEDKLTVVRTEMVAPQRKFEASSSYYWGM